MHTGASFQHSVERVASVLLPAVTTLNRSFRQRLEALHVSPQHRRALEMITPGAAAKAFHAGADPGAFLSGVRAAAKSLAMLGAEPSLVIRAAREYERLSGALYRGLPPRQRAEAQSARGQLHSVLVCIVNEAFAAIQASENRLIHDVLQKETASADELELAKAVLSAVVRHFDAHAGVVFVPAADECRPLCASGCSLPESSATRESVRSKLEDVRQLKTKSPLVLVSQWRDRAGSVWSVPASGLLMQMLFANDRPILPRESQLLELVVETWRLALIRLETEQRSRGHSLRMLEVEELERRRISRELHDDAGQSLVVIRLQMEMLELSFPGADPEIRERLAEIRALTEKTILSVRKLISELSPAVLEQLGLAAAVRQLANRFGQSYPARIRLRIAQLPSVHPRLALVVYRVLQECFANISRHSRATRVNVSLTSSDRELRLSVEDNGVGFNVEEGLGRRNCYGLVGIRERVGLLGGAFAVESAPSNEGMNVPRGTRVIAKLPLTDKNLRNLAE